MTPGLMLVGLNVVLILLAPHFIYETSLLHSPVIAVVAIGMISGLVFLSVPWLSTHIPGGGGVLIWILVSGLILRLMMFGSTPILEDDFYRYLWDGAVVNEGHDPYRWSPAAILRGEAPDELLTLAADSGVVAERINHPEVRSIYPPLAQAAFAVANWIEPWSLAAWRALLLAADLLTVVLLLALLRELGRPGHWVAIYWWNPLVIKELFNSAHMDALLLPLLLGAVLLMIRKRTTTSSLLLALASGVKVWPVLLLPFVLRPLTKNPRRLLIALCAFLVPAGLLALPMLAAGTDASSGLRAYGTQWEMNDALFRVLANVFSQFATLIGWSAESGALAARFAVGLGLCAAILCFNRNAATTAEELVRRITWIIAAMILLSPTQYPWYYVWLVPFLAVTPRYSLLMLTAVLPLYYLRFHFDARDQMPVFTDVVVMLEYLPVWLLLIFEWRAASDGNRHLPAGSYRAS